jgi:hypothetical protein
MNTQAAGKRFQKVFTFFHHTGISRSGLSETAPG